MGAEVTGDAAFSGGSLARAARDEVLRALAAYGLDLPGPASRHGSRGRAAGRSIRGP